MKRTLIILAAFLVAGCSNEPEPVAESASALGQPVCFTWAEARPVRNYPRFAAWYAAPCPGGMLVNLCNSAGATQDEFPVSCSWFDGQPYGVGVACCPDADVPPLTCDSDNDCPASGDECWRAFCNYNILGGQCMQTWAGLLGTSCGNGGVCRIGGQFRSEVDGLLIPEQGWPAVCDLPQWPE